MTLSPPPHGNVLVAVDPAQCDSYLDMLSYIHIDQSDRPLPARFHRALPCCKVPQDAKLFSSARPKVSDSDVAVAMQETTCEEMLRWFGWSISSDDRCLDVMGMRQH